MEVELAVMQTVLGRLATVARSNTGCQDQNAYGMIVFENRLLHGDIFWIPDKQH